tara:strand:- start:2524 stop:3741 length:1218 start_codon:yes stop_codon:yes gene_type:complete
MLETFDNINPTSLGNYEIPAKHIVFDFSRNTSINNIDNISIFIFTNGNIEKLELSSIATAMLIDKNLEEALVDTTKALNKRDPKNKSKYIEDEENEGTYIKEEENNNVTVEDNQNINDKEKEKAEISKILQDNNQEPITLSGNRKKIMITFPRQYVKLPTIDRIIVKSKDEMFQDTILSAKFYDDNLQLISTLNMEVTYQENMTIPYKKFVYYNITYYKHNKLPGDYNFTTEYTKNNTYFKTFLFENLELSTKVENNMDEHFDELNAYYYSNDKEVPTLKSYYSRINHEEEIVSPLYNTKPEINTNMVSNNQELSDIMKNIEKSDVEVNYKKMFNKLNENIRLDTSTGVKYENGTYIDNAYDSQKNIDVKSIDFYRGEKLQFDKKMNYKDYNNTSRASDLTLQRK